MLCNHLTERASGHLRRLCVDIPDRQVGSGGNRAAAAYFAETVSSLGFAVETHDFECMDWRAGSVSLQVGGEAFAASALEDAVVLLRGDIAREQLMPKNFPFYNPDEHQRIIWLLETKRSQALITATGRDWQMAGSLYPFPLIEDGDFDIPSVVMTDVEGERLAAYAGQDATLISRAERLPSSGYNVVARKGQRERRAVCFAHIDAKPGTPGAIDNASGAVVMLLLAELLADYGGGLGIEIVALNGEDYYSNPGEQVVSGAQRRAVRADCAGCQRGRRRLSPGARCVLVV